jgi:8-oxo-dGTP pyrophosphatase MutT (NUDIX family)
MSDVQHRQPEEIRVRVALAVVKGSRVLLVPLYDTDAGPVQWCLPGGRLCFGESLREAAEREFEEETGLRARAGELLDVSEVVLPERPTTASQLLSPASFAVAKRGRSPITAMVKRYRVGSMRTSFGRWCTILSGRSKGRLDCTEV